MDVKSRYETDGFVIVEDLLPSSALDELALESDRLSRQSSSRGGARNVLQRSPRLRHVGRDSELVKLAEFLLGAGAKPVKLTLFDKTPDANWLVRWHQDLAVTVREHREVEGFVGWSRKEGVLHVRPPTQLLESVVALRLHLDDTPASNGALRVIPGSHREGRLSRQQIEAIREKTAESICEVERGGVMAMSPLLLHASSKASQPSHRRVLHFEYSSSDLPGGLEWA